MDPKKLFVDTRLTGSCVYCGGKYETDDHVPSKVLLDEPYPNNLPVVPACEQCNNSFSSDEAYLACFIECVINGSASHEHMKREKIKRILESKPWLSAAIESSRHTDNSNNHLWTPDFSKVRNVVLKLARGHIAYECSELQLGEPEHLSITPICAMSQEEMHRFNTLPVADVWPEIGSRAFMRAIVSGYDAFLDDGWQIIQPARYRYLVTYSEGISARFILSEYLACEVIW